MSKFRGLLLTSLLSLGAVSLWAQTPDTATIRGQVTDQTHAAVSGAEVALTPTLTGSGRKVTTQADGAFSFAGLPTAGAYDIVVQKAGFSDAESKGVSLVSGTTAT